MIKHFPKLLRLCSVAVLTASSSVVYAQNEAEAFTDQELTFFETKIRPVLAENCYACHSHEAEKLKADLYLDSRAGFIDSVVAEPGKPEESLFLDAVRWEIRHMEMPPTHKLPDAVIADLTRWVEMGLPWPQEAAPQKREDGEDEPAFDLEARRALYWAWQPPHRATDLPAKVDASTSDAIDYLIEQKLAAQDLQPAAEADRTTLIRRVTYDLTGLPPTPAEVEAFVNDPAPDAYEKLVDRLLASPRYGEKWARHWLDLVRYAESYGHEFDYNVPHAWKYRDYVIRALNDDVPYDRFTTEHIAGDLVEPRIHPQTQVNEAVVATGWWFMHEQTHAPTDVRLHEVERIDNQIDVLSKTFQGMTVSCARCHDHKFDAISTADYYAIAGYLQSSRADQAYLDPGQKVDEAIGAVQSAVKRGQAELDKLPDPAGGVEPIEHDASELYQGFNDGSYGDWYTSGWAWGQRPTIAKQWDPRSGRAAAIVPGVAHSGLLGDKAVGTLRSPEFDLNDKNIWLRVYGKGEARLIIDNYTMNTYNWLLFEAYRIDVNTEGKWQWINLQDRRGLFVGKGKHRAHIMLVDDSTDAYLIVDQVRFGGDKPPPNPQTPLSTDVSDAHMHVAFAPMTESFNQAANNVPNPQRALAITDGTGEDSYVHIRGSYLNIGETVPRRNLTALGGQQMPTPAEDAGSGRLELAQSIIDPDNPLTARVQVNRLWHHLFGRGIVPTVDNFGYLGIAPSHPELLDHLAILFTQQDQWSNKAMIKRIVMTRAYRRASDRTDPAAESKDPTNRLLHRQNIRRLTAEGIRDTILMVSGSLDEKQFGPSVPVHLTEFMQGRGRPKPGPLDGQGRRSIYISVRRNFLAPMMLTFDAPIPFSTVGNRNTTNVPAQALTLMNDPFVHDQANKWAQQLIKDGSTTAEERIDRMFTVALGRPPADAERQAALDFINDQAGQLNLGEDRLMADPRPWRELGHAMYNLKALIYVR